MKGLKLKKGLSYREGDVFVSKASPNYLPQSEDEYNKLIASGYFEIDESKIDESDVMIDEFTDFSKMRKSDIEVYAQENSIDLIGCGTKEEMIEKINGAISQ